MTSAADILRERAAVAAGQGRTRDMAIIGAVADLMVVLAAQDKCPCCGMKYAKHNDLYFRGFQPAGLRARMTTALDARINAAIQSNSLDVTCQEAKGVL